MTLGSPQVTELVILSAAVPGILGVFWGAPLVAHELETGTAQFAWMQSITRRRWLTVKLAWILLAAAAAGGAVAALVTWWLGPDNALSHNRFIRGEFDVQGIVPVGYALFAVALGIAAGVLLRRTLPAMAVTLAVFAALRLVIADFVRQHYLTPVTTIFSYAGRGFTPAGSAWVFSSGSVGPNGVFYASNSSPTTLVLNGMPLNHLPAACNSLASPRIRIQAACSPARPATGTAGSSPTSPPAGSGPSRASRPASSSSSPPRSSPSPRSSFSAATRSPPFRSFRATRPLLKHAPPGSVTCGARCTAHCHGDRGTGRGAVQVNLRVARTVRLVAP